jgi:hypothetical protein
MGLLEWWAGLHPFWRYGVAIVFLLISTVLYFGGTFWPWGWGIGVVLLLFAGPSDTENSGYRF